MPEPPEDRELERFLPIANVARIMKRGLPSQAKIAKDAKECVQECVSEFISFLTSEASDRCAHEKRKTISGEDILWAINSLGFDSYHDVLSLHLSKYKEGLKLEKTGVKTTSTEPFSGANTELINFLASGSIDDPQSAEQRNAILGQKHIPDLNYNGGTNATEEDNQFNNS